MVWYRIEIHFAASRTGRGKATQFPIGLFFLPVSRKRNIPHQGRRIVTHMLQIRHCYVREYGAIRCLNLPHQLR